MEGRDDYFLTASEQISHFFKVPLQLKIKSAPANLESHDRPSWVLPSFFNPFSQRVSQRIAATITELMIKKALFVGKEREKERGKSLNWMMIMMHLELEVVL